MFFEESCEISEEDLVRMEQVVRSATPGPWVSWVVGRDYGAQLNFIEIGSCNEIGSFDFFELIGASVCDQDFIASARQFLPRLLKEVRALRKQLAEAEEKICRAA